jgi:hypothetical protein
MSTPSTTPANAIAIQGQVGLTVPLAGFLRVVNPGPETNFLDIPTDKILSPNPFPKPPPPPGNPVSCLVDVSAQLKFSDYPPATVPVLSGPVHPGAGSPPGLFDHNGKPLQVKTVSGQITQLSGSTEDGTTYTLTLNTLPKALTPNDYWSEVWISLSKSNPKTTPTAPPPALEFTITYNPLFSLFGVGILYGAVTLGIRAQMEPIYSPAALQPTGYIASLERSLVYHDDLLGSQTISMDGRATDPAIYLPIAGVFWPYTEMIGFFAPALSYLAAQAVNRLPPPAGTPLSVLAQLQYGINKGLETPPALGLPQFIAGAVAQVGPALGPFAAAFLRASDDGIQAWVDAARWMGWVLAEGAGVPALQSALSAQYNYWKAYVPQLGQTPKKEPTITLPVQQPAGPGQRMWTGFLRPNGKP